MHRQPVTRAWENTVSTYVPKPIDTSAIEVPEKLLQLTKSLAENAHDNWAALRIKEGWTWGPKRNDDAKEHPDLVPYDQLPESEQEYDRQAAIQTVKAIMALGYLIEGNAS